MPGFRREQAFPSKNMVKNALISGKIIQGIPVHPPCVREGARMVEEN